MKDYSCIGKFACISTRIKMIHQEPNKEQILVVNLSGRGDKDIFTVDKVLKEKGMQ